jgi:formylglycine-generating enzyme required for sulfatase activity/tRNA A-37 threonylcarbamoyl transferase component Bud32
MTDFRNTLSGTVLDEKFKLIEPLGKGGMGKVYRAEHLFLAKHYAVKIILPEHISDNSLIERFREEAKATSELEHENVVRVFDYGEVDDSEGRLVLAYLVMELLEGKSLRDVLDSTQGRKLDPLRAAKLMIDVCEGVDAAHAKGIISRDLKPDNVMVIPPRARKGEIAKVIDFGIAKRLHSPSMSLTMAGMPIGSPYYMAPEQWQDSSRVDQRCDVYGLGVMLYETVVGSVPFNEGKFKGFEGLAYIKQQHVASEPQIELVPIALRHIVAKALKKNPNERYQTVSEMCDELVAVKEQLQGTQSTLQPSSYSTKPFLGPETIHALPQEAAEVASIKPSQTQEQISFPLHSTRPAPLSLSATVASPPGPEREQRSSGLKMKLLIGVPVTLLLLLGAWKLPALFTKEEAQPKFQPNVNTLARTNANSQTNANAQTNNAPNTDVFAEVLPEGIKLEMVKIPAGSFEMGSPDSEADRSENEGPLHQVNIGYEFYIGRFEITQEQWEVVMGYDPSYFKECDGCPVENVSWDEAKEFCKKLSKMVKREYRLPSEAEWEYAARAGTKTPFASGSSLSSTEENFDGDYPYGGAAKGPSRDKTTPVGIFKPNAWGIYDMHGNVREWCEDIWHADYNGAPTDGSSWLIGGDKNHRVLRGGSWFLDGRTARSAARLKFTPSSRVNHIGFRVALTARN